MCIYVYIYIYIYIYIERERERERKKTRRQSHYLGMFGDPMLEYVENAHGGCIADGRFSLFVDIVVKLNVASLAWNMR